MFASLEKKHAILKQELDGQERVTAMESERSDHMKCLYDQTRVELDECEVARVVAEENEADAMTELRKVQASLKIVRDDLKRGRAADKIQMWWLRSSLLWENEKRETAMIEKEKETALAAYHCREKVALDSIRLRDRAEIVQHLAKIKRLEQDLGNMASERFESQDVLLLRKDNRDVKKKLSAVTEKAAALGHAKLRGLAHRFWKKKAIEFSKLSNEIDKAMQKACPEQPPCIWTMGGRPKKQQDNRRAFFERAARLDKPTTPELVDDTEPVLEQQSSWEDYVWTNDFDDLKSESSEEEGVVVAPEP